MTDPAPGTTRRIARAVTAIDRDQVDLLGAVRHGGVVAVVLGVGLAWTSPGVAVAAAIGALQVGFYDGRGPYRARLEVMAAATLALAAVATLARVVDPYPWLAVTLSVVVAFSGGLLVSLGPWASLAGTHSTVLFLVFTSTPAGGRATDVGLAILVGGALQAVVALVGWPWRPYGPEERALQHAWDTLSALGQHADDAHDRATVVARGEASGGPRPVVGDGRDRAAAARSARPRRLAAPGAGRPRPTQGRGRRAAAGAGRRGGAGAVDRAGRSGGAPHGPGRGRSLRLPA